MMVVVNAHTGGIAVNNSKNGNVNLTITNQLANLPSVLAPLLIKVVEHYKPIYNPNAILEKSPKIEDKISFNKVQYYADDIRVQSDFMGIIEETLSSIDNEDPGSKGTIQYTVNKSYKEIKRKLLMTNNIPPWDTDSVNKIISENSDKIFQLVLDDIFSIDFNELQCSKELLTAAQELLVCYGFIGCMVLEEPLP